MAQVLSIFSKTVKDKTRYWASVNGENEDGDRINASILVRLSKRAKNVFENGAIPTKNKQIEGNAFIVKEAWLKAVPGKEQNNVILFVNKMEVYEKDQEED